MDSNGKNGKDKDADGKNGPKNVRKFLFITMESLSGDLAWQITKEGHEVKVFIEDNSEDGLHTGFFEIVDAWEDHIEWADVVVFDDVGFGELADALRKEGKFVVGGSTYTDKLEEDREYGQQEMREAGMQVLPHWDFTNFQEAVEHIKANPGRYVFKPCGAISSDSKGILFMSQDDDGKDLVEILEQNKKLWARKIKKFQLQKMAVGVEIAVGAFFNGKDFMLPINVNFEHKKLFPGDIGPYTGEMGTLMFWSEPNEIFYSTLSKIKDRLAESGYVGYIDINCIANAKGIYPLEFTSRFGYPTISIQMEGIVSDWGEFLYGIASGEAPEFKAKKGFQVGVVVAVPPFPFDDKNEAYIYRDLSILFKKPNREGVHLGDVKLVNDVWAVAGDTGYVLIVTGGGSTVEEARKQAYSRIKNIILQNMFYRTDIGIKWFQESDKLHTWGYLR
ncbi:phosphoribosylamine--glycine ligase [Candidatus Woesearchaeota archaeon]|nr:phosphoribosylamine--glycine ligase [Candidatus Woesearchaeota archaeon]